jgi:hypothetical protein
MISTVHLPFPAWGSVCLPVCAPFVMTRASAEQAKPGLVHQNLIASACRLTCKNRKRFPGAASVSQHLLRCEGCKHLLPQQQHAVLTVAANLSLRDPRDVHSGLKFHGASVLG